MCTEKLESAMNNDNTQIQTVFHVASYPHAGSNKMGGIHTACFPLSPRRMFSLISTLQSVDWAGLLV